MKRYILLGLAAVLVIATGVFAVYNTAPVTIDIVVATQEAPVVVWLAGAIALGVLLTLLCLLPSWWWARAERRRLERELRDARDECDRLRRAPLRDR